MAGFECESDMLFPILTGTRAVIIVLLYRIQWLFWRFSWFLSCTRTRL